MSDVEVVLGIEPPREYENFRLEIPWGYVEGRWYGNRKVRPILALHGWQDNLGTWDTLIPLLPKHIGILCIDFPGHGRSARCPNGMNYYLEEYTLIVARILKKYKWPKISLLTHSMGTIISFLIAATHSDKIDMLIAIDMLIHPYRSTEFDMKRMQLGVEKLLAEDESSSQRHMSSAPCYTLHELQQLMHRGSGKSVDLNKAKYLLYRSIAKSEKYPEKYYFSRDSKIKYYKEFSIGPELSVELTQRVHSVPLLVLRATKSPYFQDYYMDYIEMLRKTCPIVEYYLIDGTHHIHLNQPEECAKYIVPFINKLRPAEEEVLGEIASMLDSKL